MEDKTGLYVEKLSKMIQTETVSVFGVQTPEKFVSFQNVLRELFPKVFDNFTLELFHGSILMYYVVGGPNLPILLMSHQDVVEPNGTWHHDPFGAQVEGGVLYGRGTLDTKGNLFAIFQALEELFEEGFHFTRSIYIESACNEETSQDGSKEIFNELRRRGVHFEFTLDEGGMIIPNPFGGNGENVAMVALGEKVPIDCKISVTGGGGHASTPDKDQPLLKLSKFITEMATYKGFKVKLEDCNLMALQKVYKTQSGIKRFLFKHAFFFRPVLTGIFKNLSPATNAMVRTTICFTRIQGSNGNNVIPETAFVVGNMRVSHYEGVESAVSKVKKVAAKYGLTVEIIDEGTPSGICDCRSSQFETLGKRIEEIFPGTVTCPFIANGASDSQNLEGLSNNIFRFAPFTISDSQLETVHGIEENVDVAALKPAVDFFINLIKKA